MFACYLPLLLLYNALDIYASYVRNMGLVCCGFMLFKLQLLCCLALAIAIALLWLCAVLWLSSLIWIALFGDMYILENLMCSLWNFYGTHSNIYIYIYKISLVHTITSIYIYIYILVVLPATYRLTYIYILIYIYSLM